MQVKVLVRDIQQVQDGDKPRWSLTIETTQPLEIHEIMLFKNHYNDGTVAQLKQLAGVYLDDFPLVLEEFNGKKSLKIPMGAKISLPAKQAPAPARAAT